MQIKVIKRAILRNMNPPEKPGLVVMRTYGSFNTKPMINMLVGMQIHCIHPGAFSKPVSRKFTAAKSTLEIVLAAETQQAAQRIQAKTRDTPQSTKMLLLPNNMQPTSQVSFSSIGMRSLVLTYIDMERQLHIPIKRMNGMPARNPMYSNAQGRHMIAGPQHSPRSILTVADLVALTYRVIAVRYSFSYTNFTVASSTA